MDFIDNHYFTEKKNDFQDNQSVYNQNYLVGVFPIDKIPFVDNKHLKNYGIPAGLVYFKNNIMTGGSEEIKKKSQLNRNYELIDDNIFNILFNNIVIQPKKNKTLKNKK